MFFKTNVLSKMLCEHTRISEFITGSMTMFSAELDYSIDRIVFSTIGPNGSTVYGYSIGEDHRKSAEARWIRIDYDTISVHHKFDNGYEISEEIPNTSVLNNEKLKIFFGFSNHELQLLATLVQHVKYRGANVIQN